MRKAITSDNVPKAKFRYSPCVNIGNIYSISGMIGIDKETGLLVQTGVADETHMIFKNLLNALPDYGLSLNELLVVRIFTTKFESFGDINSVWEKFFPITETPPARTSVGVSALPLGATVEVEFTFVKS